MQSHNLNNSQSVASVCPVEDSVGYLSTEVRDFLSCSWCGGLLPASKTKPRRYCSEAHEKAFKRARCVSKEKNHARKLSFTNDEFAHYYFHNQLGTYVRDSAPIQAEKLLKDKTRQKFSRCLQCDNKFTDSRGRLTLLSFAFCGETALQAGACKKTWIAARLKKEADSELGVLTPVPEPTKVLPEFRTFTPATPLFIGPLLKNGRRRRGRA